MTESVFSTVGKIVIALTFWAVASIIVNDTLTVSVWHTLAVIPLVLWGWISLLNNLDRV